MQSLDGSPHGRADSKGPRSSSRLLVGSPPALICFLVVLAALPYANTLHNGFTYDDNTQVLNNPYVRNFHHLREIFTTDVWSYQGKFRGVSNYYRPLMTLGYLACYRFFGPSASVFHLVNLMAHVGTVCLLFLVTRRLFQAVGLAFVAASIFALHPIHTEPVDWIGAITELELAFFYLLTFWFFLELAKLRGARLGLAQMSMAGSFALALLSKEQAVTLPAVAALYEHFYRSDRAQTTWAQKLSRYSVLWLLAVAYLALRVHLLGALTSVSRTRNFSLAEVALSGLALIGQYVWKLLWPARLCLYYPFPESVASLLPWAMTGGGVVLAFALLFVMLWQRERIASFGFVWFLATLAPVLNVLWMPGNAFAERYLYLPSVGFCWVLAGVGTKLWGVAANHKRVWRVALGAVAGLIVTLYVFRVVTRNRDWRDDTSLYRSALVLFPKAADMHNNLGMVYWNQQDINGAEREWGEAWRLDPGDPIFLHNLGLVAKRQKRYEDAVGYFLQALQVAADYPDAHLDLGQTYKEMGSRQEAQVQLRAAVALAPLNVRARNALGEFYFDEGRWAEAGEQFRLSIDTEPTREAYWGLGFIDWTKGDHGAAERAFKSAEALAPSSARVHFILGVFYAATGRAAEAVREYQAGLQYDPMNAEALAALKKLAPQTVHAKAPSP